MRFHRCKILRVAGCVGVSALALAAVAPAAAQEAEPADQGQEAESAGEAQDSEIVVTATRRAGNIQDVPVAVSVTTGETLQQAGISSFQDLTQLEPSLVVNNQGVSGNQFIIRGILSDIGSTTGFYFDETPMTGGSTVEGNGDGTPGLRLHDVARIEVLKGPQGTLFGSGSMSGTLRIIPNRPDVDDIGAGAGVALSTIEGGQSLFEGDAFINLPIASNVAVRGVAWGEFGGAYIDHRIDTLDGGSSTFHKDVNDRDVRGGRLSFLWEPAAGTSLLLTGVHQEIGVDDVQSWNLDERPFVSNAPTVGSYDDKYQLVSATLTHEAPFGTFLANAAYAHQDVFLVDDTTPTGLGLAGAFGLLPFKTVLALGQDYDVFTGEVRFASKFDGPLQIVTGAFFQHDVTDSVTSAIRADDVTGRAACVTLAQCVAAGRRQPGFSAPNVPASDFEYSVSGHRVVDQWAFYGQADYEVTPALTATVGARYFLADITDVSRSIQSIVPDWVFGIVTTPSIRSRDSGTDSKVSYNFSLLYEATSNLSFFARAASGFRIGGTNNAASLAEQFGIDVPATYGSDELWSYELGAKAYLIDRRLYVDASVYQMDWSDQQLQGVDPQTGQFEFVLNAGKTRIRGAELQLTYRDPSGLSFGGGATYTDAKLARDLDPEVIAAGTIGFKGDRVPRVPRWTFAGQIGYETEVGDDLSLYAQTNASYRSSSTYSFNDQNPFNNRLDSSFVLGAQVGVRTGPVDVALFVRNLTDEVAIFGLNATTDGLRAYSATPRSFGIQARANF